METNSELVDLELVVGSLGESWRVENLDGLDWALSRLAELEREIDENNRLQAQAIARIRLKTEALNQRVQSGVDFFRSQISAYAETHRAELLGGGKKKSRTLLHGTIGWRKSGGRLEVKDSDALLEWCRSRPVEDGVLRIKEEPAMMEIKKLFDSCGEVPNGCDVSPEVDELNIKAVSEVGDGN